MNGNFSASLLLSMVLMLAIPNQLRAQPQERTIGGERMIVEEIVYEDFKKGITNWKVEGDADIKIIDDQLVVNANSQDTDSGVGNATIWYRKPFSGPQLIEYNVRIMGNSINGHINMFLHAHKPDGSSVINDSGRSGEYVEYLTFPSYMPIMVSTDTFPPTKRQMLRANFRLNPEFTLIKECWRESLIFGRIYHVSYLLRPPRLDVFIDDQHVCGLTYPKALSSGHHALRLYHTYSIYDNFRVSRIVE